MLDKIIALVLANNGNGLEVASQILGAIKDVMDVIERNDQEPIQDEIIDAVVALLQSLKTKKI